MEALARGVRTYVSELETLVRPYGIPFELSPSGRLVRFSIGDQAVYVVRDAWGDGCSVMVTDLEGTREVQHYLEPRSAIARAVRIVREIQAQARDGIGRCA